MLEFLCDATRLNPYRLNLINGFQIIFCKENILTFKITQSPNVDVVSLTKEGKYINIQCYYKNNLVKWETFPENALVEVLEEYTGCLFS